MSDPQPKSDLSLAGPPSSVNEARLESTNSQIANISQINSSPGAVVNQTYITQVQASPGSNRTDLIVWALVALVVWVITSRATVNLGLPPIVGQAVAGGLLAGMVWKFFEQVDAILREETKKDIGDLLLGVRTANQVQNWPHTFSNIFDSAFGSSPLSWRFFGRSALSTVIVVLGFYLFVGLVLGEGLPRLSTLRTIVFVIVGNILPDYVSILIARSSLALMKRLDPGLRYIILVSPVLTALPLALAGAEISTTLFHTLVEPHNPKAVLGSDVFVGLNSLYASGCGAFFTSIWMWLYAFSGFLLKAAQRIDFGFQWFSRKFEIEKKPLSAVGLVAAALVAIAYWTVMILSRMV